MYITLFFFTNNFLTSKSVIQEYLSPFRSSKVQNVSVLLRGGGGKGGKREGKEKGTPAICGYSISDRAQIIFG